MTFPIDRLVFGPGDVDLDASPLCSALRAAGRATFVLGAFNPGMTRLANGNVLLMVRIAEALSEPVSGGDVHTIRWDGGTSYVCDPHPHAGFDMTDPRHFERASRGSLVLGLTSLSWLLPVELNAQGLEIVRAHYDKAIAPSASYQEYGLEDPRISLIDGVYYMTVCSVSAERHATSLYTSSDGLNFTLRGLALDHQNKDMLLFAGRIRGSYWALTRPTGSAYFLYPESSPYHAGPSINLAVSPDGVHWKPHEAPLIRPRKGTPASVKVGGGAPPVRTAEGWLVLFHGVAPNDGVGAYRTFWALLDSDDPAKILHLDDASAVLEANAALTAPLKDRLYLSDVVFTTGIADHGENYILASGEADLACRITYVPKARFSRG